MKLKFSIENKNQPDPFIFEDNGKFYLYVTALDGVEAYVSDDLFGTWEYVGIVTDFNNCSEFWAPAVIKIEDTYYMYVACLQDGKRPMHVARANSPLGPFTNEKALYNYFAIDADMIQTDKGLFLFYANARRNERNGLPGTHVFIDRFIDPYTPENDPKEVLVPEFDEEKYTPGCVDGKLWYTLEGPCWFQEGQWQYLMYSAGCYQDDTYHIGYAVAKTTDTDLKNVTFEKVTNNGAFAPLIIKNEFEEGTGHHSIIRYKGEYYAIYHGRDYIASASTEYEERRTARVCKLTVSDGKITAERFEDHL